MDSQSNIICSAQRLMLERNPSCVEFCPKYPSLFVVGTYNLEDGGREEENVENADDDDDGKDSGGQGTPQTRNGTLVVFEIKAG